MGESEEETITREEKESEGTKINKKGSHKGLQIMVNCS
jgi:hypothetical protein